MSSSKAVLHAAKMFTTQGNAAKQSVVKEIVIGMTLGLAGGAVWKAYHWNLMKEIDDYYTTLGKIEGPKIREQREKYLAVQE